MDDNAAAPNAPQTGRAGDISPYSDDDFMERFYLQRLFVAAFRVCP